MKKDARKRFSLLENGIFDMNSTKLLLINASPFVAVGPSFI